MSPGMIMRKGCGRICQRGSEIKNINKHERVLEGKDN
jgi:hypothetical protein